MNENKTERLRFEGIDATVVGAAFLSMEKCGYTRKKFTPTSDVSHLEIYQYLSSGGDKFTLVYDTKAKILTVDGRVEALAALARFLPPAKAEKTQEPKPNSSAPAEKQQAKPVSAPIKKLGGGNRQAIRQPEQKPALTAPPAAPNSALPEPPAKPQPKKQKSEKIQKKQPQDRPAGKSEPQNKQAVPGSASKQPPKREKEKKQQAKPQVVKEEPEKPIVIKNVSLKRLEWVVKDMKDSEGVKVRITTASFDKTKAMTLISRNKDTVELVRDERGNVTVSGKPCALLTDLSSQLESKSDIKLLKKYIPTALRYLSESSRIDLSNGITDLNNISRLSDYSVLLTAPYRALEKFIYDLQQAENINVKMIGQAYEKDDEGRYSLKKGYIKKINSVVYAEVMTALYTEYFKTRNFYTHSDNSSGSQSRGISDKAEAQKLLTHLLSVLEYNGRKLSEINFSVAEEN